MTPFLLFKFCLAAAAGLLVIGLVALILLFLLGLLRAPSRPRE